MPQVGRRFAGCESGEIAAQVAEAAALGVTTAALSEVTRIATSGDVSNGLARFNLDNRQIPILVRLNDASRSDLERLRTLSVPGTNGPVPLLNNATSLFGSAGAVGTLRAAIIRKPLSPRHLESLVLIARAGGLALRSRL